MKVLIIEHFLPDSIYTLELGRKLKKYCNLSIICRKNCHMSEEGVTWLPMLYEGGAGKMRALFLYGFSLWKLMWKIRKEKYDVIHIQTFKNAKYEIPLYNKLKKYTKKMVLTVHNVLPHEKIGAREKELYEEFYNYCDQLIVHNNASKKCLIETFHVEKDKITVIPHGIYHTHQSINQDKENKRNSTEKYFLLFGIIRRYKGIDILLEAIAQIPFEKREHLHFLIAGKQYLKLDPTDYKQKIADLKIGENVRFVEGHVPEEKIEQLFNKTDFVVFPYRNIYGSGALMLAYTYCKPVVVSDIPTFLEETENGKTGFLFKSENPQALAEIILKAANCESDQIDQYKSNIKKLVSEKYNWEKSAVKTMEVYQK